MTLKFAIPPAAALAMPRVGSMVTIEHPDPGKSGEYIVAGTCGGTGWCSMSLRPIAQWQDEQMPPLHAMAAKGDRVIRPEPGENLAAWMKRVRALMCEWT